jgi:hypothetical protein
MTGKASTRKKLALRKATLNITSVGALKPEDKPYVVWDRAIPGYGCRVQPTGRKSFILRYRPHTSIKQREITLGMFGAITPDQTRKSAMETIAARHCQTNGNRPAKGAGLRRSGRQLTPLGQGGGTVLFEVPAVVKMTFLVEMIMDRGVGGCEFL